MSTSLQCFASLLSRSGLAVALAASLAACTEPTTTTKTAIDAAQDTSLGDTVGGDTAVTDTLASDGAGGDTTVKDTQVGDTVGPKYGTCAAVGDCIAVSCKGGEKGCESACLAASDSAAIAKALPLLSCYNDKCVADLCKDSTETSCNDDCLKSRCMPELFACIDNGKPGTKGCDSMPACMDKCKLGSGTPFSCLAACYADVDDAGRALGNALAQCFASADPKNAEKQCAGALLQCFSGGKTGTQECFEGFDCVMGCQAAGGGDMQSIACSAACLGKVTKAGQDAFMSMMACFGQEPVSPECGAKFLACANPTGTGDCFGGLGCIDTCQKAPGAKDGPQCVFKCAHAMTAPAAADFWAAASCLGKSGADATCSATLLKCVAPTGTKNCADTVTCMQNCTKDDGVCLFGCLKAASSAGADSAWKFALCGQTCEAKCAGSSPSCAMECLASTCPTELAACTLPK